jgi:hypothetical protein
MAKRSLKSRGTRKLSDTLQNDDLHEEDEYVASTSPSGEKLLMLEKLKQVYPHNIEKLELHIGNMVLMYLLPFLRSLDPLSERKRRTLLYMLVRETTLTLNCLEQVIDFEKQKDKVV